MPARNPANVERKARPLPGGKTPRRRVDLPPEPLPPLVAVSTRNRSNVRGGRAARISRKTRPGSLANSTANPRTSFRDPTSRDRGGKMSPFRKTSGGDVEEHPKTSSGMNRPKKHCGWSSKDGALESESRGCGFKSHHPL